MPAPDSGTKPDPMSTPRPDLASRTDSGRSASPDQATGDRGQATDAPPETKDDGATKAKGGGKGKEDKDKKQETVECPSCAGAAEGKPAELVPYPDDGPNEFKRGTAFCEREGKRVRIDKDPDADAADAAAPTV